MEIIVGIAIFALALMPLVGLFGRGSLFTQMTGDSQTALQTSSAYLRALMGLPARLIPVGNPVALDQAFGPAEGTRVRIPSEEIINNTRFRHQLRVRYVMRDSQRRDFWFDFMSAPGQIASKTAFRQLLRLDFETSWYSRSSQQRERVHLVAYKADLE